MRRLAFHSSSTTGVTFPPSAAIWSRKWCRTAGSDDVRGSISPTDLMSMARRFALCRDPMIEYARCSASFFELATMSRENFCLMLPKGACPATR